MQHINRKITKQNLLTPKGTTILIIKKYKYFAMQRNICHMGNDGEGRDDDNSKINPERAPSHSIQRSFKHKKRSLNKNPRKVMDPGDLDGLLLLGYMLTDDDLWEVEKDEVEVEIPPKQKRVWVREWIKRRDSDTSNTMYKLQCEISEVSGHNKQ